MQLCRYIHSFLFLPVLHPFSGVTITCVKRFTYNVHILWVFLLRKTRPTPKDIKKWKWHIFRKGAVKNKWNWTQNMYFSTIYVKLHFRHSYVLPNNLQAMNHRTGTALAICQNGQIKAHAEGIYFSRPIWVGPSYTSLYTSIWLDSTNISVYFYLI